MLVSIDIKIEFKNFSEDTNCMLLLLFLFLSKLFILCSSAYKRYGFVTINLSKQYKNKERCENLNNSIYSDNSVG